MTKSQYDLQKINELNWAFAVIYLFMINPESEFCLNFYSLLVCITTGRDEWVLEPYVWGEDLLKDLYFVAEAHKARECPLMNP